ncbi:uncharacterized protein LOC123004562 [Tribolium madens]|uniref:uncharacterized protein LOC123004562 n=1 Tax=Tribolium madens TaxID=41895 RepID=UPI001CF72FEA|nr:uncharacterized protein LOC123004562 [Tribolium madens]
MISNMCLENESDLLLHWFLDIGKKRDMYNEPILGENTVKFFKQICDTFEQSSHVFIMSIEVAENYLRAKISKNQKITDPLLAAVTIAFICHKCEGALESLKIKHVVDLLFHLSQKYYNAKQVLGMEGDILITLNGKIQMTTVLDDMDVIIEKYMSESRLKGSIRPLCLNILEYVYFERKKWFKQLKEIYSQSKECMVVFQHLISSKFYIPVSVLITAIELTHYRHVLDVDTVLADVTKHTRIHEDHVRLLAAKMIEIIKC